MLVARLLQIERFEFNFGEGRELLPRCREECGGDIAEHIGMLSALDQRQHLGREPAGACADFQNTQSASFGKLASCFCDRSRDRSEPGARDEAVAVKLIEQIGTTAGEQDLHGLFFTAHDGAEVSASCAAEQRLGHVAWIFRNAGAQQA